MKPVPAITGVDHLALTVTDLEVSVPFYTRLLGADPITTLDDGPFMRRLFELGGGAHLGLTQHDHGSGRSFDPTTPGLDHLGLAVHDRTELEAWRRHLDDLGLTHGGIVSADYGLVLSFADPDGIALEFFVAAA